MDTLPTTASLRRWWQRFLDELPDFHARLFITATVTGFVAALVGAVANYLNDGEPALVTLTLGLAAASLAMIWFAKRTGRSELARVATVIIVYLVIFPYMFFIGGGYHSGMPALLVFGMGFTALALVGPTDADSGPLRTPPPCWQRSHPRVARGARSRVVNRLSRSQDQQELGGAGCPSPA